MQAMMTNYRSALLSYSAASTAGLVPRLPPTTLTAWNSTLNKTLTAVRAVPTTATVNGAQLVGYLNTALSMYQYDSVLAVGQVAVFPGAPLCNNNVTTPDGTGLTTGVACPAPSLLVAGTAPTWPPA
jgi:hypothetical protein